MNKQVIFVTGASYSGTTILDRKLASYEGVFSAGEMIALYFPIRSNHLRVTERIHSTPASVWNPILRNKLWRDSPHLAIFDELKDVHTIIDSSKSPSYISRNMKRLKSEGVSCEVVLIYKDPVSYALSHLKRDSQSDWAHAWQHFHTQFLNYFHSYTPIKYQKNLEEICNELAKKFYPYSLKKNLPYYKEELTTLFGNASARNDHNVLHVSRLKESLIKVTQNNEREAEMIKSGYNDTILDSPSLPLLRKLESKLLVDLERKSFQFKFKRDVLVSMHYNRRKLRSLKFKWKNR